jgi:25S rRNA (adenine2142-N1)-methyltransferase
MSRSKRKTTAAKKSVPLAPPPQSQSRKRARTVTTLFHRYTRKREEAVAAGDLPVIEQMDRSIVELGGRREYQRASQISTSFHSTSKWVLGCLARNGWLYGILLPSPPPPQQKRSRERRPTRVLEVGAINTELLDAAKEKTENGGTKYRLQVRAIDLHSMHEGIEEADFLQLSPIQHYDVIVCSMVLNCVPTAAARGEMVARLYHFSEPGSLVFLTIPKTCLALSPYMDRRRMEGILRAVGFEVMEHTKDSPKVAYFVCQRPDDAEIRSGRGTGVDEKWTKVKVIYRGKKYRNAFAVTLSSDSVAGTKLLYANTQQNSNERVGAKL